MFGPGRIKIIESESGHQIMCEIEGNTNHSNYLTQVVFRLNNQIQAELLLGASIADNPVLGTELQSLNRGDQISIEWRDLRGNNGKASEIFSGQ